MSQQHIAMIIDGLPGGGAEKVVLTLSQGLIDLGHRVTIISLRDVCHYPLPQGIHYHVVNDNCRAPWRKLTELKRRSKQLDKIVKRLQQKYGQFDLAISHLHKTDRIVRFSQALNPQKTWYCLHGVFSQSYLKGKKGLAKALKSWKIHRVYQQRKILAVSDYVLSDLCQEFYVSPSDSKVIANPFDSKKIQYLANQAADYPQEEYLLHVGRLHPTKRHDRLLEAYAACGLSIPLVLLGDGSSTTKLHLANLAEALGISERVIFAGFDSNPYPWIKHARLLVLSSDSEGFGNVLVEALLCGTQVVSTNCPGGPSSILIGDLARGLADLSSESLAEKIRELYETPAIIDQQGLARYELSIVCQAYLTLIDTSSS